MGPQQLPDRQPPAFFRHSRGLPGLRGYGGRLRRCGYSFKEPSFLCHSVRPPSCLRCSSTGWRTPLGSRSARCTMKDVSNITSEPRPLPYHKIEEFSVMEALKNRIKVVYNDLG